ncbi:MAG: hypothetical protein Q9164_004593 [Protoblastenia rupestris]
MLAKMEDASRPKNKTLDTDAAVKPEASISTTSRVKTELEKLVTATGGAFIPFAAGTTQPVRANPDDIYNAVEASESEQQ